MCVAWNIEQPKAVAGINDYAQDVPCDGIRNAMRAYSIQVAVASIVHSRIPSVYGLPSLLARRT